MGHHWRETGTVWVWYLKIVCNTLYTINSITNHGASIRVRRKKPLFTVHKKINQYVRRYNSLYRYQNLKFIF